MIQSIKPQWWILLFSILLFVPFLGAVPLFDWDEINFAEAAREMILTGDYFTVRIDFMPFWEKPPLFIWMQVVSMKIFGINAFAARLPNAVAGIVTLQLLYRIGNTMYDKFFGLVWVLIYVGMILPFLYFKSGIIDPWFNLFIFLSIYHFYLLTISTSKKRILHALFIGLLLGLAVLTKGPVSILIFSILFFVYWLSINFKRLISFKELLIIFSSFLFIAFFWFGLELIMNGPWFLEQFIVYQIRLFQTQDAGHGGPFFYHWVVLLFGCFPASLFMLLLFKLKGRGDKEHKEFYKMMFILFWVVLILFSIVKTKIIHYSSLCYFPISFLACFAIYYTVKEKLVIPKWLNWFIVLVGGLIAIVFFIFPIIMMNVPLWVHLLADEFAKGNLLADIPWSSLDSIGGLFLIFGIAGFIVWQKRKNVKLAILTLFGSITITMFFTSILLVPKIELFSQGAAIRFYKSLQGKDVYVQPMFFKSYAHLFYAQKQIPKNKDSYNSEWLLTGNIDKPTYIVTKNSKKEEMIKYSNFKLIKEENGFVFYLREPLKKTEK